MNSRLCLLIFFIFSYAQAETTHSHEIFNRNWNYSSLRITSENDTRVHTKIFRRQMWIGKVPITLADTNFIFIENPQKDNEALKNELSYIADSIKKSFGNEITITGQKNHFMIKGKFEKINRYIKVDLTKNQNRIHIISTFSRLGFHTHLEEEINALHQALLKYDSKMLNQKKTSLFNRFKFIEQAQAQAQDLNSINISSLINGSNVNLNDQINQYSLSVNLDNHLNEISQNVSLVGKSIDQVSSTGVRIADQAETANLNWTSTNVEISKANETAKKFADEAAIANKNWADTNKEIGRANDSAEKFADEAKAMNTNWAESNKIIAKTMDPEHMAKVAFYTAAGAALGGIAVNLAIQGVSEGAAILHELFTGDKKKKLEWSDFEKAMNAWDTQLNDLVKMEQLVDNFLDAFKFFENKKIDNNYLNLLSVAVRDMKFDKEQFQLMSKNQNLELECRKTYFNASDELDKKIQEYESIIQFATKNNLSVQQNNENFFCGQLKQLQKRILDAETQMQDLRLKILVAEGQFYHKQSEAIANRDKDINKVNKKLSGTLNEKNNYSANVLKRIKYNDGKEKSAWLSICMKGKNEQGKIIKEETSKSFFLFKYFKKKKRCKEEFARMESLKIKKDQDREKVMAAEENLRKQLNLNANNNVELMHSEEQMSWMSKIHMDAYCYQFSHNKNNLPKKCKDFPEVLYSLSLSKGYEKANEAYKNKCMDRYISGLEHLAKSP